jgi:hypothetical protein
VVGGVSGILRLVVGIDDGHLTGKAGDIPDVVAARAVWFVEAFAFHGIERKSFQGSDTRAVGFREYAVFVAQEMETVGLFGARVAVGKRDVDPLAAVARDFEERAVESFSFWALEEHAGSAPRFAQIL